MQRIAAEVGFSETAFLFPDAADPRHLTVRYFSPLAEVPFCGHATIASAVALAERNGPGRLTLDTTAGEVVVSSRYDEDGALVAALTSVAPRVEPLPAADLDEILAALRWDCRRPRPGAARHESAFAGAWHPVVAAATRARLADLDLRLRPARAADGGTRLDHRAAGLARDRRPVPRARPVPARWRGRGSGDRARRRPHSAPTCARSGWSRRPAASPCTRARTSAGRAGSPSTSRPATAPITVSGHAVAMTPPLVHRRVLGAGRHERQVPALAAQDRAPQALRLRREGVGRLGRPRRTRRPRRARPRAGPRPTLHSRRRSAGRAISAARISGGVSRSTRPRPPETRRQPSGSSSPARRARSPGRARSPARPGRPGRARPARSRTAASRAAPGRRRRGWAG